MADRPIVIVGAGLAGLCTAWFLSAAGRQVRVIERREDVAMETSHANGGMLTPSASEPWNAPGVQWLLLKWLGREDAPMLLRVGALGHYLSWGIRFLANARPDRFRAATEANFRLSSYSLNETRTLRQQLGLVYGAGTRGTIKLFRNAVALEASLARSEHLKSLGLMHSALDRAGVVRAEPLLAEIEHRIAGGIRYPGDETGDAHLFCRELARRLTEKGVTFDFGTRIKRLLVEQGRIKGVVTSTGTVEADAIVVAAAAWSAGLVNSLGVRLAVRPVKGYSLSIPVASSIRMLELGVIDDEMHAVATPLDGSLRLAGTAEFCGWDSRPHPGRTQMLWDFLGALSPTLAQCVDRSRARPWCGFRPMSADGCPYIGRTGVDGLYINTGHGHLGWTQAVGSGKLLSQLLLRTPVDIDVMPFDARRG